MNRPQSLQISKLLGGAALLAMLAYGAFTIFGGRITAVQLGGLFPGFREAEIAFGPSSESHIRTVVSLTLLLIVTVLAAAALIAKNWQTLQRDDLRVRMIGSVVSLAVMCVLFYGIAAHEQEGPWYRVVEMMTHPETVPVFGQRLLMIWPAVALRHFLPQLTHIQAYIVIQGVGVVLAVYAVGEWSALFIGRELKFLGQILLVALLLPTEEFFLAHDIGVVFSYCFCLLFLGKRRYLLFLLMFSVGVLNHQNILLLIPTAIVIMLPPRESFKTIAWVAGAATVCYFGIQAALNYAVPVPATHELKVWFNMRQIVELHRTMIFSAMLTIPWYIGALLAFKSADTFLKRASVLLPMQFGMYCVYGQLNEPRLFHGFLPVLIGIYLCYVRERVSSRVGELPGVESTGEPAGSS